AKARFLLAASATCGGGALPCAYGRRLARLRLWLSRRRRHRPLRQRLVLLRLNAEQVHVEDEHRSRRDRRRRIEVVGELRRNEETPLRTWLHQLQRLLPARNRPIHRKAGRLAA